MATSADGGEEKIKEEEANGERVLTDEKSFILSVSQFFNHEALSDVILKVDGQQFFGHRFVLAKSSDVFRTMLYEDRWAGGEQTTLDLTESPECQPVFGVFLRYMYTAAIPVTVETAVGILCLADKYNVASLKTLCVAYMVANTKSPLVHNALNWYSWAKALNLGELVESCTKTIAWNIEHILGTPEWNNMDMQFVFDILNNSSLVVTNEFTLYNGLVEWLLLDTRVENLLENASTLLPLIRFPQMLVKQLYAIENSDFARRDGCRDTIQELIGKAYRFRSLCPSQLALGVVFTEAFYNPRNYMDLVVDNVRMQNTLRFGIQVDVRTSVGPVPSESRDGDWKIIYRKNGNNWSLQLFCHDSATVHGEAYIEASIIIYNEDEKVVQVDDVPPYTCTRSNYLVSLNVEVEAPECAKAMVLLIKPIPH